MRLMVIECKIKVRQLNLKPTAQSAGVKLAFDTQAANND